MARSPRVALFDPESLTLVADLTSITRHLFPGMCLPENWCFWAVRIIGNSLNVFLRLWGTDRRGYWAGLRSSLQPVSVLMLAWNGW